jgi:hypothetical protein
MTEQEQVQVTQADRDAAAFAWVRWHSTDTLAEAFARHRHTATAEALEAMREAREALGGAEVALKNCVPVFPEVERKTVTALTRLTAAIAKIEGQQP